MSTPLGALERIKSRLASCVLRPRSSVASSLSPLSATDERLCRCTSLPTRSSRSAPALTLVALGLALSSTSHATMSDGSDWRAARAARMHALERTTASPAAPSTSTAGGAAQGSSNILGSDGVLTRAQVKRDRIQLVLDPILVQSDFEPHIIWNPVGYRTSTFVNSGSAHVSEGDGEDEEDEAGRGQGVPIPEAILARPAVLPKVHERSSETS